MRSDSWVYDSVGLRQARCLPRDNVGVSHGQPVTVVALLNKKGEKRTDPMSKHP